MKNEFTGTGLNIIWNRALKFLDILKLRMVDIGTGSDLGRSNDMIEQYSTGSSFEFLDILKLKIPNIETGRCQ